MRIFKCSQDFIDDVYFFQQSCSHTWSMEVDERSNQKSDI